ncbi:DUF4142 domain-containing protein [Komagataeibacter intermedius]|uniref:DUF4142 domain-containing protein n=2 Tax=Komagataeibacter intermedius TaxID=66229 RepID=A0A0C1RXT3_9PROT|nr:DUF4142 domain-containing protein [Komagataeibacter intermedius]KPH86031.1 hypothetical protein GLUCOINTEAF2_0200882 [Komagataeibacter intermedius AF2]KPH86395.1 hypothetical protein GLUCOINTEAF2_0200815 [Komagataeibacter intermedius AF2]MCF3636899.1 DUF4142 domain-containing protein [Komagataeibacter intermedius]
MKKSMMAMLGLAICMSAPAVAQSIPEKTGVNSLMGIAPRTEDFIKLATISDMFEIQSSELALQGNSPALTSFATQMVEDHKKTSAALQDLLRSGNVQVQPPTALDESHQDELDKLKGLHGRDFALQYRTDQISGHEDAVSLFRRYAEHGENASLKTWAANTLPMLENHLRAARSLPQ